MKKALALIAHGIPAIAIRGITQWRKKGTIELHDEIAHFATANRQIHIIFDQDEKPKTQRDVRTQALKLGNALEGLGCRVGLPIWEMELGKGIDDVLYGQGDDAQQWLNEAISNAPSLKDYKQYGRVAAAIATINRLNKLSFPTERETSCEYLPELPPLLKGSIHAILAPMNSGKTFRIKEDWVKEELLSRWFVLIVAPLNSLGKQTSKDIGVPHIHDFDTKPEDQQALWALASHSNGLVMCPDSLHRIPNWLLAKPLLLILDEANQVVEHMAQGNTLGSRQSDILERFSTIATHAAQSGAIVLSEDGLPDRAVKFVQSVSGCESVRVFKHQPSKGDLRAS